MDIVGILAIDAVLGFIVLGIVAKALLWIIEQ